MSGKPAPRPPAPPRRLWPWLLAGVAGLALAWALLGPALAPLSGRDGARSGARLSPDEAAMMFREIARQDDSIPGRQRLVVDVVPGATYEQAILKNAAVLSESLGRMIARQLVAEEPRLAALEVRLRDRAGALVLRLRHAPGADGWDGKEDWQWQVLPLRREE